MLRNIMSNIFFNLTILPKPLNPLKILTFKNITSLPSYKNQSRIYVGYRSKDFQGLGQNYIFAFCDIHNFGG